MVSGDGCSATCQTESITPAVCQDLIVSDQTISTGGSVGYECRTNYYPLSPPLGTTYSVLGGIPLVTLTSSSGVLSY
jgi:hypothetical protein